MKEGLKVVVPMNLSLGINCNLSKDLHSNDSVDEEEHEDEDGNPRKGLERLDKRPKESPDAFSSGQEFHKSHNTEQPEEVNTESF